MNIDDLTLGQIKQIQQMCGSGRNAGAAHPWQIGKPYLIRTVTHFILGVLVGVYDQELELSDASWVADMGRFAEALKTGKLVEVEPYPDGVNAIVGRGAVIDSGVWLHDVPRAVVG